MGLETRYAIDGNGWLATYFSRHCARSRRLGRGLGCRRELLGPLCRLVII